MFVNCNAIKTILTGGWHTAKGRWKIGIFYKTAPFDIINVSFPKSKREAGSLSDSALFLYRLKIFGLIKFFFLSLSLPNPTFRDLP